MFIKESGSLNQNSNLYFLTSLHIANFQNSLIISNFELKIKPTKTQERSIENLPVSIDLYIIGLFSTLF